MAGADADFASAIGEDNLGIGGGGALRAGLLRDVGQVTLISEFIVSHAVLNADGPKNASITAAKFGGKLRFLKDLEPGIFVHIGGARVAGDQSLASTDIAFDMGISLDLTMLPLLDLGAHAAWNRVFGGPGGGIDYGVIGLHGTLVIEDKL
jgi:hypothetical protein